MMRAHWLTDERQLQDDRQRALNDRPERRFAYSSRIVANPPKPAAGASNGNRAVASGQSADRPAEEHEQPGRQDAEVQQATATGAA